MSQQTDILSVTRTTSGTAVAYRTRVKGIYYASGASAGSVVVKNGGVSGTTILDIATPALATAISYLMFPGEGILCSTDVYLAITNATSVTIFYG